MFGTTTFPATLVLGSTIAGTVVGLALAGVAWTNRDVPAATPFGGLLVAAAGWSGFYALQLTSETPARARMWATLAGVFATAVPILWLTFALEYTDRGDWLTRTTTPLVWAEPAAYLALALASPEFGFTDPVASTATVDGLTLLSVTHAAPFYFHLAYGFVVVAIGFGFLTSFALRADRLYRRQAFAVVVAGLLPVAGSVLFLTGATFPPVFDLTPVSFVAGGVVVALSLFRYDFLDVAPLAADLVLAEMDDPVLVLRDDVIVEHNDAAGSLFAVPDPVDRHVETAVPGLRDALAADASYRLPGDGPAGGSSSGEPSADEPRSSAEPRTDGSAGVAAGGAVVFDPRRTVVRDHHGVRRGEVVVLRETTLQKRREETLRALQSTTCRLMDAERRADIADVVVETVEQVLDHPFAAVLLRDDVDDVLRPAATTRRLATALDGDPVVSASADPAWRAFESGEAVVCEAAEADGGPGDSTDASWLADLPVRCLLALPLGDHGTLVVGCRGGEQTFGDDERRLVRILAATAETALDRARREAQLRASRATVAERNEQIEFFNGVLRHDILNGMTVVSGNLELLEDHVDEEGRRHLETVSRWSEDVASLTRKVRSVVETVTATESVSLESVSLSETLREKARKVDATYEAVAVRCDVDDGLRVRGNDLLGEVVENLLLNAVEHAGSAPEIEVRARRADDAVRVEIADDGPGIPDEMKSAVFEREVTAEESGSVGFGLHFASVMMEQYGGEVWFEDADAGGAVAVLSFPTASPGGARGNQKPD
ncbi:sensor histidine kinase [Halomicrococcus gelatinilyticus]|uniref:sensor histidine kinase n=1 Tax=Halomicrococcus gelatinilyticus TaxID=1702103 RepID=UPI002E13A735